MKRYKQHLDPGQTYISQRIKKRTLQLAPDEAAAGAQRQENEVLFAPNQVAVPQNVPAAVIGGQDAAPVAVSASTSSGQQGSASTSHINQFPLDENTNERPESSGEDSDITSSEATTDTDANTDAGADSDRPLDDDPFCIEDLDALIEELAQTRAVRNGITKGEIILMVLKMSIINNFTHQATIQVLNAFNTLFTTPLLPPTEYQLKKLVKLIMSEHVTYHFMCKHCGNPLADTNRPEGIIICDICDTSNNTSDLINSHYFITFDLAYSLSKIFNKPEVIKLIRKSNLEPRGETICDMQDGDAYKNTKQMVNVGDNNLFVSLTTNSDGSPLCKSSNFSVWPIQSMINELPPKERAENLILVGLWFGPKKPTMETFLVPYVDKNNELSQRGMLVGPDKETLVRVFCVCVCVDSVARAPMQGMRQFNAYNSCNWCHHPGTNLGSGVKYPMSTPEEQNPRMRTSEETIRDMEELVATGVTAIHGIKTLSPLINLVGFDIIWGFVPDPLHCVDLGVVRQFAHIFFDSPSLADGSVNKAYIGSPEKIEFIDKFLLSLKVPNTVHRHPRGISDRSHWKGIEWENFLLLWSAPIFKEVLPKENYSHWLLLVEAIYILHKTEITRNEVVKADELLYIFVTGVQKLYSPHAMTYNVHQLLHLAKSVMLWGPLWAHSGFVFESGNGQMKRDVKSVIGIPQQIIRLTNWRWTLTILSYSIELHENVQLFLDQVSRKRYVAKSCKRNDIRFFGTPKPQPAPQIVQNCVIYKKMHKNGFIFHASCDDRRRKSRIDGSHAVLDTMEIVQIKNFYLNEQSNESFADVKLLRCTNIPGITQDNMLKKYVAYSGTRVIRTSSIVNQCVALQVKETRYFAIMPYVHIST